MNGDQAADIVRRGYHSFNTADLDLFSTLSVDELTWETPGQPSSAGMKSGREAVCPQYGAYLAGTEGTFKAELHSVTANEQGQVVGIHRNAGQRNGKTLDTMCSITFEVADGKILSGKEHFFDLYNWDQFWSRDDRGRPCHGSAPSIPRRRSRVRGSAQNGPWLTFPAAIMRCCAEAKAAVRRMCREIKQREAGSTGTAAPQEPLQRKLR